MCALQVATLLQLAHHLAKVVARALHKLSCITSCRVDAAAIARLQAADAVKQAAATAPSHSQHPATYSH